MNSSSAVVSGLSCDLMLVAVEELRAVILLSMVLDKGGCDQDVVIRLRSVARYAKVGKKVNKLLRSVCVNLLCC